MAVYAIGDIQGCYEPLRRLLDKIDFDPQRDRLWCVGDLVNRGPDSLKVLRFLKGLGRACIAVLGNHDLHLLGLVAGEQPYRRDTLEDVLSAPDRDELIHWLRFLPMLHHNRDINWCMVHAGLHPSWNLSEAKARARSVEDMLRSDVWQEFCTLIHSRLFPRSDPPDGDWEQTLFSAAVLTRSRCCTREGVFNWYNRGTGPESDDELPWFLVQPRRWARECRVVYGHWAAQGLVLDQEHVLGLDSGCVWGGSLTAARLDSHEREIIQVRCKACQQIH
jgi:bis(5'-nucleosyl)-tetraphosphatase (symmetrical)